MKQWNRGENKTQRYLGKNLTGQLDAEDEAGNEDDFKNSSLGDWIDGEDIRSETGHTGKTGSWSYFSRLLSETYLGEALVTPERGLWKMALAVSDQPALSSIITTVRKIIK